MGTGLVSNLTGHAINITGMFQMNSAFTVKSPEFTLRNSAESGPNPHILLYGYNFTASGGRDQRSRTVPLRYPARPQYKTADNLPAAFEVGQAGLQVRRLQPRRTASLSGSGPSGGDATAEALPSANETRRFGKTRCREAFTLNLGKR